MSPFLVGLILMAAGLAGVFWGYRIFRILLPIFGGIAGYLIALSLFPNNLVVALVIGFGLAFVFVLLAYTAWSIMVTISGVVLGAALGAAIASGLYFSIFLSWIVILVLAVVGGYLVWKLRDEVVIILTAVTGAAFVATGLRIWFGAGTILTLIWWVIFIVLAVIGIAWQWRRYRHLHLLGMGGPAETPGATRAAPVADVGAPVAAAPAAAPAAAAAVAAGAVVAETKAEAEPPVAETAAPVVEAAAPLVEVAPAVVAGAVVAETKAEAEPLVAETAAPVVEAAAPLVEVAPAVAAGAVVATAAEGETPAEQPAAPEVAVEPPVAEAVATADMEQLKATLDGTQLAAFQEKVEFVEGIGPTYAGKLNEAGIVNVMDLLHRGATRKGRTELVEATGIAAGLIMKWVNNADLFRVKGVGKQFAELLEAAGVDTVPELAQRNPLNLFNKLSEVNAQKKLAGRSPHQAEVESWVAQAKSLPRIVEY